jgi:hypothetical protein
MRLEICAQTHRLYETGLRGSGNVLEAQLQEQARESHCCDKVHPVQVFSSWKKTNNIHKYKLNQITN